MNIAIYTLTRDRIDYSKRAFALLKERAGMAYDHYIVDNGSKDGTAQWLAENRSEFYLVNFFSVNKGLAAGGNEALDMIAYSGKQYDLIIKMDNDCEVVTDNILVEIATLYGQVEKPMMLSPQVTGINRQPKRSYYLDIWPPYKIGVTGHIGGIFLCLNAPLFLSYRYPLNIPLASGDDSSISDWVYTQRLIVGYIENLVVHHMDTTDGQVEKYPEYFKRKWKEEYT